MFSELEELAENILGDKDAQQKARIWALSAIPKFIYVDEYPELDGHQDIAAYIQRKSQNHENDSDKNFERLCKVAGLDPDELLKLHRQDDFETRNQLANRRNLNISIIILEQIRTHSMKNPCFSGSKSTGMFSCLNSKACCFNTD